MGIVRSIIRRRNRKLCMPGTFMYARPDGVVGFQAARNSPVDPNISQQKLLARIEALIGSESALGAEYGSPDNVLITVSRVSPAAAFLNWSFKYMVIYERRNESVYSVFYINHKGEIKWIAGSGSYRFERIWSELEGLAIQAWKEAA